MRIKTRNSVPHQTGFSLVEIMVGMVIGMLGIIIMMQVFSLAEGRKRTTTAGSDAQNNAFIALDTLQRDITHSGYGFTQIRLLGCDIQLPFGNPVPLAPVIINLDAVIPPGDEGTDTLLISYGTSNDQPDGYKVESPSPGPTYLTTSNGNIRMGDMIIHAPAACPTPFVLRRAAADMAGRSVTVGGAATTSANALFNLGAQPRFLAYAVRNRTLTVCNYMDRDCGNAGQLNNPDVWRPIIGDVVSLRAQYGRDGTTPMDGIVDTFDRTTPTSNCEWARVSAIRLALVTRSAQFENEKNPVTGNLDPVTRIATPPWAGDRDLQGNDGVADEAVESRITLSRDPNWGNYRYRIFETLVPIRNVAWMGVVPQCL